MAPHPRLSACGTSRIPLSPDDGLRALVFAPDHEAWVQSELAGTRLAVQIAHSVRDVIAALVGEPPPRPQILIVDLHAMSAGELLDLHAIREQGWFGTLISIGSVPRTLHRSLGVERTVLVGRDKLRPIAALAGQHTMHTLRMPRVGG